MRIIFSGSRRWDNRKVVKRVIKSLPKNSVVVHGGAPGLDSIAHSLALKYGLALEVHHAEGGRGGRAAGPKRNQQMIDAGADTVYAFPVSESKGTWDLVNKARSAGIPVNIIPAK